MKSRHNRSKGRVVLSLGVAFLASGCSGGGGSGISTTDDQGVTEALERKIVANGVEAITIKGTPPPPTGDGPVIEVRSATVEVQPGQRAVVPLSALSTTQLGRLFAKIPGADRYFQIQLASPGKELQHPEAGKAETLISFEVDVPTVIRPDGTICFDFSIDDIDERVSESDSGCIGVVASEPTPEPTTVATFTSPSFPAPTPSASPSFTPTPEPTGIVTVGTSAMMELIAPHNRPVVAAVTGPLEAKLPSTVA